jgi:hypothetical protein
LIAAPGDCADERALRPEGGAQGCNLGCQTIFLDDPARPHAGHQRVFADDGSARLDQRHQNIEGAAAELDRSAVSKQLAVFRQHSETTERHAQRRVGSGIHRMRL